MSEVTQEMIEAGERKLNEFDSASLRPGEGSEMLKAIYLAMKAKEQSLTPARDDDVELVERVAERLANQIAMRKGCPPIKGCLALMPADMADIFRDDARAAIAAMGNGRQG